MKLRDRNVLGALTIQGMIESKHVLEVHVGLRLIPFRLPVTNKKHLHTKAAPLYTPGYGSAIHMISQIITRVISGLWVVEVGVTILTRPFRSAGQHG